MGYTHYWYRPRVIEPTVFKKIVNDCKSILHECELRGLKLANWDGKGRPTLTAKKLAFNGSEKCGHPEDSSIGLCWPSPDAGGVASDGENAVTGSWFAGPLLATRVCNGDCSYESFVFDQAEKKIEYQRYEKNYQFNFTKTNYRPYDIAVTACLIAIKHHCSPVYINSDGEQKDWFDGAMICQTVLGYGLNFTLDEKSPKDLSESYKSY